MPVLLKDPECERVIRELAAATNTTLTAAVRDACEHQLRSVRRKIPLRERIAVIQKELAAYSDNDDFDSKRFFDEAWGHEP